MHDTESSLNTPDFVLHSVVDAVQNPALGAGLVWACASGFHLEAGEGQPLHLVFLVLPMVLHEKTRSRILSTNPSSGLAKFSAKYKGHEDDLLAIQDRALILRKLTLDSVSVALISKILTIDYEAALVLPLKARGRPAQSKQIEQMLDASTKLGHWFARLPLPQILGLLRVEL